jgi:hypothetical protein
VDLPYLDLSIIFKICLIVTTALNPRHRPIKETVEVVARELLEEHSSLTKTPVITLTVLYAIPARVCWTTVLSMMSMTR